VAERQHVLERIDRHGYDDCSPPTQMRALVPVGRALFSLIFITSVFGHFSRAAIASASAHGVPFATVLVPLSGILALAGGLSVLLGYRARFGAFLLLLVLVPVTLIMHRFWAVPDPQLAALQKVMFMKNLSMIGGALVLMYYGAGPVSLDN
jgi:putative oxidoreductase